MVWERVKKDMEIWNKVFGDGMFKNYNPISEVEKLYQEQYGHINFYYQNPKNAIITMIDSCTGGFLDSIQQEGALDGIRKNGINNTLFRLFEEDFKNLDLMLEYLQSLNAVSQDGSRTIHISNFPKISDGIISSIEKSLSLIGKISGSNFLDFNNGTDFIDKVNKEIQLRSDNKKIYYTEFNQVKGIQNDLAHRNIIKIDNHPTINEQYTVLLYNFFYLTRFLEKQNGIPYNESLLFGLQDKYTNTAKEKTYGEIITTANKKMPEILKK